MPDWAYGKLGWYEPATTSPPLTEPAIIILIPHTAPHEFLRTLR